MFKQLVQHVWEFKQVKDLCMSIVAPRNLFIEFMHDVRPDSPLKERGKPSLLKILKVLDLMEKSR